MSVTQSTSQYPTIQDKFVGQLVAYEAQLHALTSGVILRQYPVSTVHEIGEAVRMITVLAHDMEYLAQGLTERYDQAEQDAQAARLLTQE